MRYNAIMLLTVAGVLTITGSAKALEYQITIIEPTGLAYPFCINDNGQIVGSIGTSNNYDSFIWKDGNFTLLNKPNDVDSMIARSINNSGQIVGECLMPPSYAFAIRGFLLEGESLLYLPPLGSNQLSTAYGINNRGYIAGQARENGNTRLGCVWEPVTLNPNNITDIVGISWGRAMGINDNNEAVGDFSTSSNPARRAFIYDDVNGLRDIGVLPGQVQSYGYAINNKSQVVGYSTGSPDGYHAFLYDDSNGVMTDLGTLNGAVDSAAYSISNSGIIVGRSIWADDSAKGCLWIDGQIIDVNNLLYTDLDWTITLTRSINNNGRIVGTGVLDGQGYAILLTPVGHLNYDNDVDLKDLAIFGSSWGRSDCNDLNNWCGNTDINHNGKVDLPDLGKLTEHWLENK